MSNFNLPTPGLSRRSSAKAGFHLPITSQSGLFNPRLFVTFTLCFVGALLAMLTFAATPAFAYPRPGETTTCVGVRPDGTPTPSSTYGAAISGDGSLVAFQSFAQNLVPDDTNGRIDTFVRDLLAGTTGRVSVASDGTQAADEFQSPNIFSDITSLDMSSDGHHLAFIGRAANLVPDDTNNAWDVFVHDLITGKTERASVATGGTEMADGGVSPNISEDGRFVAFSSDGLFVRDRVTGVTERVDVSSSEEPANFFSYGPSVSDDGRWVAFQSSASNLVIDTSEEILASGAAIFLRDRELGTTIRPSGPAPETKANGYSWMPDISGDGRYSAYYSEATDLIPQDTNPDNDVFVYDRITGLTRRVSVASDGTQSLGGSAYAVAISHDGRFVTFSAGASNLVPGDTNAATDVFVHDLLLGLTERVSVTADGSEGALMKTSEFSAISDDGGAVAFESLAGLVPGGDNGVQNVYRRLRGAPIAIIEGLVTQSGCSAQLSGTATFAGAILSAADDAAAPAPAVDIGGADLARVEIAVRIEQEDLRVRFVVPGVPGVQVSGLAGRLVCFQAGCPPSVTSSPYVGYRLDFNLNEVPHRIVVNESGAVLEQCSGACVPLGVAVLQVGTTGQEVVVSFPLTLLGGATGQPLTGITAASTLLASASGSAQDLDSLALPDTVLSGPSVRIGVAAPGVPAEAVTYTTAATPNTGSFSASIASPADGSAAVLWAQPCIGATCGPVRSWPISACLPPPVELLSVASRKVHGTAGTFDVDLPLTGNPGIECRSGGANGDYTLVFSFTNPLTSVAGANVTSGTGSVQSSAIDSTDAHQYIVNLTGVTNAQAITVSLSNVTDPSGNFSSSVSQQMGVLLGDTTGNGTVNSSDIGEAKGNSGQTTTASNFRTDVTVNGTINSSDIGTIKAQSGTALP